MNSKFTKMTRRLFAQLFTYAGLPFWDWRNSRAAFNACIGNCGAPGGCRHWSDCSVHNEPLYPAGPCDCGRG